MDAQPIDANILTMYFPALPTALRREQLESAISSPAAATPRIMDAYTALRAVEDEVATLPALDRDAWLFTRIQPSIQLHEEFSRTVASIFSPTWDQGDMEKEIQEFNVDELRRLAQCVILTEEDKASLRGLCDTRSTNGFNCLHATVYLDYPALIPRLIESGADVNEGRTETKWTALHESAMRGRLACVAELIRMEANIDAAAQYSF